MSATFTHYTESHPVIDEPGRRVEVSMGDVGGLELVYLGVAAPAPQADVLMTVAESRQLVKALQSCDVELQDRTGGYYLYRVVITKYPEGALYFYDAGDGDSYGEPDRDWRPEGWEPDDEWLQRFGDRFFWPSTKFEYKSQSSARARAKLIESYGATAVVERSSLITWPGRNSQ